MIGEDEKYRSRKKGSGKQSISFDAYEKAAGEGVRKFGADKNFLVYHLVETEPLNFVYSAEIRQKMEKRGQSPNVNDCLL